MNIHIRQLFSGVLCIALGISVGCSTRTGSGVRYDRGLEKAQTSVPKRGSNDKPPLIVQGHVVPWSRIMPGLSEAAGATVMREIVLSMMLDEELAQQGLVLKAGAVETERGYLVESMRRSFENQGVDAGELIERIRLQRGLGPVRFGRLLESNAKLRLLVQDQIIVKEQTINEAYQIRHGPRYECLLITTQSRQQAVDALKRISDMGNTQVAFSAIAQAMSTDPSAANSGRIGIISPADTSITQAIRSILSTLQAGQISPVIAMDDRFALIFVVRQIPPTGVPMADVEDQIRQSLTHRLERLAMEQLADRLVAQARVTVFDRSLDWSWNSSNQP